MRPRLLGILWLLVGLCVPRALAAPSLPQAQLSSTFERAQRAFEQAVASTDPATAHGHYRQAVAAYEQLLAAGVSNAKLYYNLGNAYFRLNDLGQAILQYRRGLRLEPGNRRLQANLSYARSRRVDQIERSDRQALWARVLFWQDDLSLQTQWSCVLLGYGIAWLCALAHRLWRRPAWLWGLGIAACASGLFALTAWSTHTYHTTARIGVIVADEAVLRKGNGESYTPQLPQPLHAGTECEILETRGTWLSIRLENGTSGWLRRDAVALP